MATVRLAANNTMPIESNEIIEGAKVTIGPDNMPFDDIDLSIEEIHEIKNRLSTGDWKAWAVITVKIGSGEATIGGLTLNCGDIDELRAIIVDRHLIEDATHLNQVS